LPSAEQSYQQAIAIYRRAFSEPTQYLATAMIGLGAVLTDLHKPCEAEPLLREGLTIYRSSMEKGHWQIARVESVLGGCLVALQRFEEAELLLLESYRTLKAKRGDKDKHTQQALNRMIKLYEAWGKPDKAGEYRAALVN